MLTTYLSWRWCMYINVILAGAAIVGGALLIGKQPRVPSRRLDIPGVLAVSSAMFCVVFGFSRAAAHGWSATSSWGFLLAGVVLLTAFAFWQTRAAQPLLPLRVVLDRNRAGAYLTVLISGAATFGVFLFLIYYMQVTLGYSAVRSGVAMLPMVALSGTTATLGNTKLLPKLGPKPMVITGMLINTGSMIWLTRIDEQSNYASALLGPLIATGVGMGLIFGMVAATGTFGVDLRDAGIASASINTGQQLGGSIGTALLNTIAASASTHFLADHLHGQPTPRLLQAAAIHSYTTVYWWCAALFAAGSLVGGILLRRGPLTGPAKSFAAEATFQPTLRLELSQQAAPTSEG